MRIPIYYSIVRSGVGGPKIEFIVAAVAYVASWPTVSSALAIRFPHLKVKESKFVRGPYDEYDEAGTLNPGSMTRDLLTPTRGEAVTDKGDDPSLATPTLSPV